MSAIAEFRRFYLLKGNDKEIVGEMVEFSSGKFAVDYNGIASIIETDHALNMFFNDAEVGIREIDRKQVLGI